MMNTKSIQKPRDGRIVHFKKGDNNDIINVMIRSANDKRIVEDVQQFVRDNRLTGSMKDLERLWSFVKYDIQYLEDGSKQDIQYPSALWQSKAGDCKSKTLFIGACLEAMGIPWICRFATYSPTSKYVTHVYPVALIAGKEIIIDAVWDYFNEQKEPKYKVKNYKMEVSTISGIGNIQETTEYQDLLYQVENGAEFVGSLKDKIRDFILKKCLKGFLYVFIDFPVTGKTLRKKERQTKILNWASRKFNIPLDTLMKGARAAIKKQFKKEPEELLADFASKGRGIHGIGCIEPATFVTCIAAVGAALVPIIKALAKKDGVETDKDDFKVDLGELASDTTVPTEKFVERTKMVDKGVKTVNTNVPESETDDLPTKGGSGAKKESKGFFAMLFAMLFGSK